MLCFVGMLYPLHALNLNILNVRGRSYLFLRLEIIKKIIAIPTIILGILFGIKVMIFGMFITSVFAYYLNSYYSGKLIGYSIFEQIKDILPSFILAATMGTLVYAEVLFLPFSLLSLLIIQLLTGALFIIGMCEILHFRDYIYIKEIVREKKFNKPK
jgi:O-antigen/teichoic acid export membrane protein